MRDLVDPFWMKVKAALFLVLGFGSGALLLLQCPSWRVAACLAIAIWSFCRFYYFAFYVIEHLCGSGLAIFGALVVCAVYVDAAVEEAAVSRDL
jgi:hypothetical protein